MQPTIPFLCTRVKEPDVDDWKKLLRMLKYLEGTKDLELILEAEKGDVLMCKWYPDAAFAVHADFKSHTGAVLSVPLFLQELFGPHGLCDGVICSN